VTQEKVTAYEAGLKAQAMDGKISFNLAGFYMDYRDKQVRGKIFDFIFGTLDALVNVPKSRIWGLEADVGIRPVEGLTIKTTTLTELEFEDDGGKAEILFVPIRPGKFEFWIEGYENRGMAGDFIVE
jgi:outer membrane receptor protein involved in Fe transport